MEYLEHEERVKNLFIRITDVTGEIINVAQVNFIYSKNTQANVNIQIFNEKIYLLNKDEIDNKVEEFKLKCQEELNKTEIGLLGTSGLEELKQELSVTQEALNELLFITMKEV